MVLFHLSILPVVRGRAAAPAPGWRCDAGTVNSGPRSRVKSRAREQRVRVAREEAAIRIGQLAELAGVSVDTVRFYERRGVLPPATRRPSGYRDYSEETAERIKLAKTLQANGFTLAEIIDALHDLDRGTTCADERWRLEQVLDRVDRQIDELRAVRATVLGTLADCDAGACRIAT